MNLDGTEDGFQPTGAEPAMGVQHLIGRSRNAQRKAHISAAPGWR